MMQSMTAFARTEQHSKGYGFCWELRSVNHRYLDVSFRLPDVCRFLEGSLRVLVQETLRRGKVDCFLKLNEEFDSEGTFTINDALVSQLLAVNSALVSTWSLPDDLKASQVLTWPGVIKVATFDETTLAPSIIALFKDALAALVSMRTSEGISIRAFIKTRLNALQEEILRARTEVALTAEVTRNKWISRLQQLPIEVDCARVEQEVALMLVRLDVSEELDRLDAHLVEVARTLDSETVAGRRLDFLMQELNREANTLSSKSNSVVLTQHAVQIKVLIEQMREQIQNIE